MGQVLIIGIAGGSCSGKTRLLRRLARRLGERSCSVVLQDDYYFSQPAAQHDNLAFNFDHPDALDFELLAADLMRLKTGETVQSPRYDFARHVRVDGELRKIEPRPVVLVDGILILNSPSVRQALDLPVFIRCDRRVRLHRRIERDVRERGRERDNVIAQFQSQVEPMHQAFVEPSAAHAERVFDQRAVADERALSWLLTYCRQHAAL